MEPVLGALMGTICTCNPESLLILDTKKRCVWQLWMNVHSLCMYNISAYLIHTRACLKINPYIIFHLLAELKWLSLKCHCSPIALEDRSVFKLSTKRLLLVISPIIWQPWCGLELRYHCDQCCLAVPLPDGSSTHGRIETKLCWKALINGVATCAGTLIKKASSLDDTFFRCT